MKIKGVIICVINEASAFNQLKEQLHEFLDQTLYDIEWARSEDSLIRLLQIKEEKNREIRLVIGESLNDFSYEKWLLCVHGICPETLNVVMVGTKKESDMQSVIDNVRALGYLRTPYLKTDLFMIIKEALKRYDYEKIIHSQERSIGLMYDKTKEEVEERKKVQEKLDGALKRIEELDKEKKENIILRESLNLESDFRQILGQSEVLQYVLYRVEKVSSSSTTVLILGETGTGKELIARFIHDHSPRQHQPMVKVNCAALPHDLIESELFGHEKGAFTGAYMQKPGKFELANNGTIFLDEIGELPMGLQAKLLRAIEENEIERLGGTKTIKTNVRVIAATNRNLEEEVNRGAFRKDLYYRLNVYPVTLPPLRKRKEDIPVLVHHFISLFNKKIGKLINSVSQEILDTLMTYDWPGNVRELENVIERGVILSGGNELEIELPENSIQRKLDRRTLEQVEKDTIINALNKTKGKISGKSGAAYYLNVNPSTLRSKMKKLGIQQKKVRVSR